MQKPKVYTLNAARFDTLAGFYTTLYRVIPFLPEYKPAHNLDALHDVLYSGFGKLPVILIWKHAHKSKQDLGFEATRDFYQSKLPQGIKPCGGTNKTNSGNPYNIQWVHNKITALENDQGETLFEILLELFAAHKTFRLILN
ncbi:RNAse (barnase) inhibitor barstar [Leeuwenhoekiella aestuarii]|uniref:RNAse (Barnase) inhibitor barstar n=1 Tax=Leeuwenhoekiella aestuarii TaxID=2249426 RepID=A0A4Q0NWG1_9FLAO|nr:barstar family protein [Leeuwenhoekiella aestuarii]RXG15949.1 RNAse (barnase) inhibitor barstar [Leeuwenhoekiella aestuarii]RXG16643.1 RNAse (barnase) inhibitor barstar [Leeuwenhoekiella aestuarii]